MSNDLFEKMKRIAEVEQNVPLSSMTTLRIGGPARYVVYPDSTVALDALMRLLKAEKIPYKVIGKGSNLLCSDKPFDGAVIRLDKFDDYYFLGNDLIACLSRRSYLYERRCLPQFHVRCDRQCVCIP